MSNGSNDTIEIARYQFHSWSRRGIANNISQPDDLGAGTAPQLERAQVPVDVALNGSAQTKNFLLIGPGDIIGVNSNMVVRTEPLNWITNFEPNYLAFIEFYDEDFTWRYTPASPTGEKLRPWLLLLVLKAEEFDRTSVKVPLPTIQVKSKDVFPPPTETWLWAHMHSNADIPDSELSDYEKFLLALNQTMNADPDQLYSRLICPRKLEPNTAYNAFLVPAFETGRLAGLQQDTKSTQAQAASWDGNGAHGEMPVYFEWYFHTGLNEDFESLVKQLEPRAMDPSIGIRDMDCSEPGFVEAEDPTKELPPTQPKIIGLEGALKSPSTVSTVYPDPPGTNDDFQVELQKIANLPITIIGKSDSGDPIISVPIYGSNHAKQSATDVIELDVTKDNWVNDLNRDPRNRVPAGFGTVIVQGNQSNFMRKAWAQVTGIVQANKLIKSTVFMMKVALQFTLKTFNHLPQQVVMAVSKPVLSRIMGSPTTVYQQIKQSRTPVSVFSGAFRRRIRSRGKFIKKLSANANFNYSEMVSNLNTGAITAGPITIVPAGLPNTQDIASQISGPAQSAWLDWLIKNRLWLLIVLLIVFVVAAVLTGSFIIFGALVAAVIAGYIYLTKKQSDTTAAANLADPQKALDSIASVPPQPSFSLMLSSETTAPAPTPGAPGADSVEGANFRVSLTDIDKRMAIDVPVQPIVHLDITNAYTKVSKAIHPHTSFPLRLAAIVMFPSYIPVSEPDKIFPAMAYPDLEDPMYKYLCAISQELLLPNIRLVPPDTISLLQTNPKFIESYMVGLNHEMGRELLWNEYPTDERGSYFRQFWDVKGIIEPSGTLSEAQQTEAYKDITPLDAWAIDSSLGSHNNREPVNSTSSQAVLIIRGELLKRYPNTLIFAQKAFAGATADEPVLHLSLDNTGFATEVKFPMYKADAPPDIKFFGFDLTIDQARGTEASPGFPGDNYGWFFVIQEVPGEPRFGMDAEPEPDASSWDDLSWDAFQDANMKFITISEKPTINVPDPLRWGADSADMAYILFRKPSMVAVHASEMLASL